MCKKVQKCTSIILLVFLSSFWFSGESYPADPKVRIIVNPNTTEVEAGAEPLALTAQAIGTKLKYKWTLIGSGEISAADLPAVFYTPPAKISGKSAQAVVTVTITDNSGQETTESVTFNILANLEQEEPTPPKESKSTSKGMSKTTKIALGAGAVAALGGGIALIAGGGDGGDGNRAPRLVSSSPPNGATNVPVSNRTISFTFDQRMNGGYSIDWSGTTSSRSLRWSPDMKTLNCEHSSDLPAGRTIEWVLNRSGGSLNFQNENGIPLPETSGSFSTQP